MVTLEMSVDAIRKWQRHFLLRQYGDNGQVLQENLDLSGHIDCVIASLPRYMPQTEDEAAEAMDNGRNTGGGKMRRI